jgi:hypothetical protein
VPPLFDVPKMKVVSFYVLHFLLSSPINIGLTPLIMRAKTNKEKTIPLKRGMCNGIQE